MEFGDFGFSENIGLQRLVKRKVLVHLSLGQSVTVSLVTVVDE